MSNHTAQDLLAAVGVTGETHKHLFGDRTGAWCVGLRPPGADIYAKVYRYTGPALGTPELDAVLWVEGQRWLREAYIQSTGNLFAVLGVLPDHELHNSAATLLVSDNPGHALAAAIKEVKSC